MRTLAPALLIAASAGAQTYTNNFGAGDPAPQEAGQADGQYNVDVPPYEYKPWDITSAPGAYSVSGWITLPQSYINQYPAAAGAGSAPYVATLSLPGLASFEFSDLNSVSLRMTFGESHAAAISFALLRADGKTYNLYAFNTTSTTTTQGDGSTLYTFSDITLSSLGQSPSNTYLATDLYSGLRVSFNTLRDGSFNQLPGSFLDVTFNSASLTLGTPIPEPSTYGLILGGLALAGAALRRRKAAK